MKLKQPLSSFLRYSLNYQVIMTSWGISDILIEENQVSFFVTGFNYCGKILIKVEEEDLIISSSKELIGKFRDPVKAIYILDEYIEANDEQYNNLFNLL